MRSQSLARIHALREIYVIKLIIVDQLLFSMGLFQFEIIMIANLMSDLVAMCLPILCYMCLPPTAAHLQHLH